MLRYSTGWLKQLLMLLLLSCSPVLFAQVKNRAKLKVLFKPAPGRFSLASAELLTDEHDAEVVQVAAQTFSNDVKLIIGSALSINHQLRVNKLPVIIGTIGNSALINTLIANRKINVLKVKGQWETFAITVVDHPFSNIPRALVIVGSDPRGTAFGVFELSRMMGVSPMVWWADVVPEHHHDIYISPGTTVIGPPSVKYRGIFLNDEDWGLQPWAAKNMDTDVKDIGPKTYQKVFELMLRLKANYIWPAMHPCTKAFWYYPENAKLAEKYAIVLGASHCEPMLRNNVFEWADNFKEEYGVKPGEWRYDVNQKQIYNYWDDRAKASKNNDAVYTVGMRGIHDGGMPGPPDQQQKVKLLENVINDQREILTNRLHKPVETVPQIFCPYKEVLDLYQAGMQLPDDITIAWADDNYGHIRQLSNPAEQKRSGRSGVYYHLSYYGSPADYLWLSTNSPALISYEMSKAYHFGADRVWIFNAGDIKPAEAEIQFAMDMAWDVRKWEPSKAGNYMYCWAAETFGGELAKSIAEVKEGYYELAAAGKPEHIDEVNYSKEEEQARLLHYREISTLATSLVSKIPSRLQDAYYQLIWYPVTGARLINEKIFYAKNSLRLAANGDKDALFFSAKAQAAYDTIQQITQKYNAAIAGGKWNGMMSSHPRDRNVFKMPPIAKAENIAKSKKDRTEDVAKNAILGIKAGDFQSKTDKSGFSIKVINGLGVGGRSITVLPFNAISFNVQQVANAPSVIYDVDMQAGINQINVICLPTFPIYDGLLLRYGIAVNNGPIQLVGIATKAETKPWATNVLRGFAKGQTVFNNPGNGKVAITLYFPDPGLVINSINIKHQ